MPAPLTTLPDGRTLQLRPITPADRDAERAFILRLSPAARRNRFLEQITEPSEALLDALTQVDHVNDEAFGAFDAAGALVGVSRYAVGADPTRAEMALTVDEAWLDGGLHERLLEVLVDAARRRGLSALVSVDAASNTQMADFALRHGFRRSTDPDDAHQVLHTLQLDAVG